MDEAMEKIDVTIDNIGNEDLTNSIIKYGLFLGALFQLVCIGACILYPNGIPQCNEDDDSIHKLPTQTALKRTHRMRKPEKKKRR